MHTYILKAFHGEILSSLKNSCCPKNNRIFQNYLSRYFIPPGALGGRLMMAASSSKFWISEHFSHYWNVGAARRALAARFIIGNLATRDEDFYSGNFLFMQMDSYQQISSRGDRCGSKAAPFIGRKCERIFLLCFYCRVIAVEAV